MLGRAHLSGLAEGGLYESGMKGGKAGLCWWCCFGDFFTSWIDCFRLMRDIFLGEDFRWMGWMDDEGIDFFAKVDMNGMRR